MESPKILGAVCFMVETDRKNYYKLTIAVAFKHFRPMLDKLVLVCRFLSKVACV